MKLCLITAALLVAMLALAPQTAFGATPRASLTEIQNDVMCPSCREPLALAQSPQAYRERAFILALIAQGETKAQIEQALVAQYGPAVLLIGLITLAVTLPRWRKRSRAQAAPSPSGPVIKPADARRLEDELARYEG
ncbi:MAG TPA: cytochrome c-type biogenesis protein CcmH [Solirubrobacteraceae bacterium]